MFRVELENQGKIVSLLIETLNTSISNKWAASLKTTLDNKIEIRDNARIVNLNHFWTIEKITETLNDCISEINEWFKENQKEEILENFTEMNEKQAHKLHLKYEILIGPGEEESEIYKNAPARIRKQIEQYNTNIHRWEARAGNRPYINIGFRQAHKRERLSDLDLESFTMKWKPGTVYLDYCHNGKDIVELFYDKDEIVSKNFIVPQFNYSSDFQIDFKKGPGTNKQWVNEFEKWKKEKFDFFYDLGIDLNAKKSAIGCCPVGYLVGNVEKMKQEVFGSTKVLGVRAL